ncbi:putative spermidine/putrescine transport system permease protein [Kaistia defluvii]|uniref:Spermidine/putrescine transport system permease protein n=2 Tax=Kaistiaceae TaxID=2831111 RepID=A0ABV2R539_9HYPH
MSVEAIQTSPRVTAEPDRPGLRRRLANRGIDGVTLMILPALLFVLGIFVYPFLYGLVLSFNPLEGDALANYREFFSDPYLYNTIGATLRLAVPVTLLSGILAVPIAMRVRLLQRQRLLTTILVLPITLGTVLVAEGLLNYLGAQGWFNRTLMTIGLIDSPLRLTNNYWGVFVSLVITVFPFTFLLTLSYISGVDPALERAAATHGANSWQRFRYVLLPLLIPGLVVSACLTFVQAFSVFPSAVLLGAPSGPTRVISIAAAQAAFEEYNPSKASAIAMIMAAVQLLVVAGLLGVRSMFYRGSTAGGKG